MDAELTPEQKFNAEPPETLVPRALAQGRRRESIIAELVQLDWSPEAAAAIVDRYAPPTERRRPSADSPAAIHTVPTGRPTAITVVCIVGFIGAIAVVPLIFLNAARQIGAWYPPMLAASALIGFTCMIGLWKMRRWAVFVYAAFCVVVQIILLATGRWNVFGLLMPAIVITIGFLYLKRMK